MHDFRRGSEWRKWDLHAHTPLDNAWENKPNLYSDEDKRKFAKEYITFAKQQGLSAIAITDHNFCNNIEDCLIKYIQQEAVSNDIVVFPGFEITAKDGSGIHILCIFPEDTNLNKIHEIVKRCFKMGTQLQGEFVPVSDKTITELKKEIDDAKLDSVLIFAHAESDNGIFNKKVIQGQRRIEEWHNPAVEMTQLSCPIENLSSKYKCFCDNNDSNYRRKMAYIFGFNPPAG